LSCEWWLRLVSIDNFEWRFSTPGHWGEVEGVFDKVQGINPVVLLLADVHSHHLLDDTINALYLAIGILVEGCSYPQLGAEGFMELLPKIRSESAVLIAIDIIWQSILAIDVLDKDISHILGCVVRWEGDEFRC